MSCSIVRRVCRAERTDQTLFLRHMRMRFRRPSRPESYALDTTPYKVLRFAPTARIRARLARVIFVLQSFGMSACARP